MFDPINSLVIEKLRDSSVQLSFLYIFEKLEGVSGFFDSRDVDSCCVDCVIFLEEFSIDIFLHEIPDAFSFATDTLAACSPTHNGVSSIVSRSADRTPRSFISVPIIQTRWRT